MLRRESERREASVVLPEPGCPARSNNTLILLYNVAVFCFFSVYQTGQSYSYLQDVVLEISRFIQTLINTNRIELLQVLHTCVEETTSC